MSAASSSSSSSSGGSGVGIITIGNPGVGKSFLLNRLLGQEAFDNRQSAKSVTTVTKSRSVSVPGLGDVIVYDIPGLIENKEELVDRNKKELYRAFESSPDAIVLFVLTGGNGGRLNPDDVLAYQAIDLAYGLTARQQSVGFIVNQLALSPGTDEQKYQQDFSVELQTLLGLTNPPALSFVSLLVDKSKDGAYDIIRMSLISVVGRLVPSRFVRTSQVELLRGGDALKRLQTVLEDKQIAFAEMQHKATEEYQRKIDDINASLLQAEKTAQQMQTDIQTQLQINQQQKQQQQQQQQQAMSFGTNLIGGLLGMTGHPLAKTVGSMMQYAATGDYSRAPPPVNLGSSGTAANVAGVLNTVATAAHEQQLLPQPVTFSSTTNTTQTTTVTLSTTDRRP